jgi:raffinose/stachyose/melibiose transport system permease protein
MVSAIRLSFFDWNGFATSTPRFVGIDNYVRLFTQDPVFWTAFRNSVVWVLLSLAVPTGLGLLMAMALNRRMLGRNLMLSVFYIPAVLASIAVATMWTWIYNPMFGLLNQTLAAVGLEGWAQEWLGNQSIALYSIFVAFVWQTTGFNMVLFLAGLQTVPPELVESARVDGASPLQVFRHVTLPALRPTTAVVLVLTTISSLKVFDLIVGMTGGGPAQSTQVLALWSYTQSFGNHDFGIGNAVATVLLVISLALVVPYLLWTTRKAAS